VPSLQINCECLPHALSAAQTFAFMLV
jgi:hypothetical protein